MKTKEKKTLLILFLISLVLAAAIALPYAAIAQMDQILLHFPGFDKIAHFLEHSAIVLGVYYLLWKTSLCSSHGKRLIIGLLFSLSFSLIDEWLQSETAERSFELADIAANILGALTVMILLSFKRLSPPIKYGCLAALLLTLTALTYNSYAELKPYYTGMRLEKIGEFNRARKHYVISLQAGNSRAGVFNAIAWLDLVYLAGDRIQALAYAKKAVELKPNSPGFLDTYGLALMENGYYDQALQVLQQAYALDPDIYTIHYHLARAYYALGDLEKAARHCSKQIGRTPRQLYSRKARQLLDIINTQRNQ